MSTITSPRPSAPAASVASSAATSRTTSPAPTTRRANRSALRDYYNLKASSPVDTTNSGSSQHSQQDPSSSPPKISPLDDPSFDAPSYISSVLASQSLSSILKTESSLINEIKGLAGERKALVYDNYSKLITATDTIRKMRANMDPLTPTTGTLGMSVGYIAETAAALAEAADRKRRGGDTGPLGGEERERAEKKRKERDTVRWVLGTPKRLRTFFEKGQKEEAQKDWDEVKELLEKWKDVKGVEELTIECERLMDKK
ncbi:hypothetical protein ACLMJK_000348 [Lecanora helva]